MENAGWAIHPATAALFTRAGLAAWSMLLVGGAAFGLALWVLTAAGARRFQDMGLPGWLSIGVTGLVFLGDLAPKGSTLDTAADLLGSAAQLLLVLWPGTRGENRYGTPPA